MECAFDHLDALSPCSEAKRPLSLGNRSSNHVYGVYVTQSECPVAGVNCVRFLEGSASPDRSLALGNMGPNQRLCYYREHPKWLDFSGSHSASMYSGRQDVAMRVHCRLFVPPLPIFASFGHLSVSVSAVARGPSSLHFCNVKIGRVIREDQGTI